jgi:translation initiation factor 2 beta subunit (eIF-2beta)/eIF-5
MKCLFLFHRWSIWRIWSRTDEHDVYYRVCDKCGDHHTKLVKAGEKP